MNFRMTLRDRVSGWMRRPYILLAVPLAMPVLLATPSVTTSITRASIITPPLRYSDLAITPTAQLPEHALILTMEEGDTLDSVLLSGGLTNPETATLTRAFGQSVDVRRLRPGNLVRFHYDANRAIDSVELKVNGWGE